MSHRQLLDRYLEAFNARDLDAWTALLHDEVEIAVDGKQLRGRAAARAYADATLHTFPAMRLELERVVAEDALRVVARLRVVNLEPERHAWRLEGSCCEIHEIRDGQVARLRSYYSPGPSDHSALAAVPSRGDGAMVADEQSALRRVATVASRGADEAEVFGAVVAELAHLTAADASGLLRFEPDGTASIAAAFVPGAGSLAVTGRAPVGERLRELRRSARPARMAPDELPAPARLGIDARRRGIRTAVSVPVTVDGAVWGAAFVASRDAASFPARTERRIARFTELLATAIAGAQSRTRLGSLLAEQAALRRVAERVAHGASPASVSAALAEEIGALLGAGDTAVLRFDGDGTGTILASWGRRAAQLQPGTRMPLGGVNVATRVHRLGRSARMDDYESASGQLGAYAYAIGTRTAVGCPILVEGRRWGVIVAARDHATPFSAGAETRLARFAELLATAVANAQRHDELLASRARMVAAADETRRRIQRELHERVQQRLGHSVTALRLARDVIGEADDPACALLGEALAHARRASGDLQTLVCGMVPEALERHGLRIALGTLAGNVPLDVQLHVPAERLPAPLERTAYFVASEALTNTIKHARATTIRIQARTDGHAVELAISDDGCGGADPQAGSGLAGLGDRVAAAGGSLTVISPRGAGTTISARLPLRGPVASAPGAARDAA